MWSAGPVDAGGWDRRYAESDLVWSSGPNMFVVDELAAVAPGRALDLACGEGRNALWLASLGWDVTGLDFSAVALERGRSLAAGRGLAVAWQQQDLISWDADEAADLVLLAYVHLLPAERHRLVQAARRAVAPGGRLLLVGHDLRNLTDGTGGPQEPSLLWQPSELPAEGWDVVRSETAARPVGELTAWDTVVHLRRPA